MALLQVRLNFGQTSPLERHLVAMSGTTSGQADLCSDIPPGEASSGHDWPYFRSD